MEVFRSISLPKKLTFIGSDGRNYDVICKPDDQLCKDARVIDVGRVGSFHFLIYDYIIDVGFVFIIC